MTDAAEPANGQPTDEQAALAAEAAARGGTAPPVATFPTAGTTADERPELAVGAAFAGGLVLALFLKRHAR
jgi:hypothetical protein